MIVLKLLVAMIYGVLEGITEWLPISSTGHIILLSELLPLDFSGICSNELADEFFETFEVVIQLGAVFAVAVIFFRELNFLRPGKKGFVDRTALSLWVKIGVACMPSAAAGIVLETLFSVFLKSLYTPLVVASMLIAYGLLFILMERRASDARSYEIEDISYVRAFAVGCFQALAIIPGTSRSGATIIGARCLGMSRSAAARFSFFMAIPTMLGASAVKTVGFFEYLSATRTELPQMCIVILAATFLSAFAVSLVSVRFLISFASRKGFAPFGVYRIALGLAVILYFVFIK